MSKELLEQVSIALDTLAFFVASPDFLGKPILNAISERTQSGLGLFGHKLDDVAKRLLRSTGLPLDSLGDVAKGLSQSTGVYLPAGRVLIIVIAVVIDSVLYAEPKLYGVFIFTVTAWPVTAAAIVYVLSILLDGVLFIVERAEGKGLFFIFGSMFFIGAKAVQWYITTMG
jgi:hypothetical protein